MDRRASLEVREVGKVYPGTVALNRVSLAFEAGEVHALIGKNGAGKSTLVKIISGATRPTSGRVLVDQREIDMHSPRDAFGYGIATVYQEMSLVPELSVGHNILLADLPTKFGGVCIDWPRVHERAQSILNDLNIDLDVRRPIRALGVASQQMVEIAKAMSFRPRVLLLDEPTSALARHETESLFRLIRDLAAKGVAIIYISHRLQELQRIAHKVSALRDGELVGSIGIEDADPQTIAHMMFGEVVPKHRPETLEVKEEVVLEVRGLTRQPLLHDIHFTLRRGEVLGIAGLVGSGRSELLRAISGADPFDEGEIFIRGRKVKRPSVGRMKRLGVGLTPEDRQAEGLVLVMSTLENVCLACMARLAWHGIWWKGRQRPVVERNVRDLHIAAPDVDAPVATLSGGNQQKVVVAKWLNTQPQILLFDEPTRGIDIQAKQQIFQVIWDLSKQGISTIFVSSELEEVVEVCHRILVLRDGRLVGETDADNLTPQQLFEYCVGGASTEGSAQRV